MYWNGSAWIEYTPQPDVEVGISTAFETNDRLHLELNYDRWSGITQGEELEARVIYQNSNNDEPELTYTWFIDGVIQNVTTDSYPFFPLGRTAHLPTSGLSSGTHYGLVVVTIDGAAFAQEFSFRVN